MNRIHPPPALAARRVLMLAAAALALPAAAATAGSGQSATESRSVGPFSQIVLRGDIDLQVRQAPQVSVQATADANLLPLLETFVESRDGQPTLVVQWRRGEGVRPRTRARVSVDVVRLSALSSTGSGDISVSALQTEELALSIAGSSDARLERLETSRLKISIAGSGDVSATGSASRLDIAIAGSGDVRTRDLVADAVSISIAGSGDASVHAAKTLSVSIAGSGDVDYGGGAVLASSRVSGSGTIRQRP